MTQVISHESRPAGTPELARLGPRIDSLDLLRGLAILGIFLMNTWTMSLPQDAYTNPAAYSPDWDTLTASFPNGETLEPLTGLNYWVFVAIHEIADMKFITMFSIMFGTGILLQGERAAIRGKNPWAVHYARMGVLLAFGLIHAYALWYGDILYTYAVCGLLFFPIRRLPPSVLILLGVLLIASVSFIDMNYALNWHIGWLDYLQTKGWEWGPPHGNNAEIDAYRGGWWHQMKHRAPESFISQTFDFPLWEFPRCGGAILIGMALQKRRFFNGSWAKEAYATIAGLLIPVGWMVTYLGVAYNDQNGWEEWGGNYKDLWGIGVEFNYWGSLITTFGYISFGVLLAAWAADAGRWILRACMVPIRSVGRTALSNYIGQSIVGTTLFYGHGFGLFGKLSRAQLVPIVLAMWVLQMTVSTVWLRYFRQGPLEWLWHSIVYWKWRSPLLPAEARGEGARAGLMEAI